MLEHRSEVKSDMLSLTSTVQEMLRALYFYGTDYIMIEIAGKERLLHKEQLVALLEQGREKATLEDMIALSLHEPLSAKMQIENISPTAPLLLFAQPKGGGGGELSGMTFEEYRERKILEAMIVLPEWWEVPLPLLHLADERISLNESGAKLVPGGAEALAPQYHKMLDERIFTIRDGMADRTFSLFQLTEEVFLLEDISGDFEMAEDLVWWAAVGKAFVRRMEENGLAVKRLSPYEAVPADAAEVMNCSWEGELVGRLAFQIPVAEAGHMRDQEGDSPTSAIVEEMDESALEEITSEELAVIDAPAAPFAELDESPEGIEAVEENGGKAAERAKKAGKAEKPAKKKESTARQEGAKSAGRKKTVKNKHEQTEDIPAELPQPIASHAVNVDDAPKRSRGSGSAPGRKRAKAEPSAVPEMDEDNWNEASTEPVLIPSVEAPAKTPDSINKNAARKAYGGRGLNPAARKTGEPEPAPADATLSVTTESQDLANVAVEAKATAKRTRKAKRLTEDGEGV